jgi:hypothetical protein
MPTWEYKILVLPFSGEGGIEEGEQWLNAEGSEGWEVVAVVPKVGEHASLDCFAVLKRPKKVLVQ